MSKKHLTLKKLDITNLKDVMSLQTRIISNLHPDEQHFILHRTEKDYLKSLSGTSSNMLGVFDNDKLIAQIIYALPQNGEQRDMPEFKSDIPNNELVIYEAILVDPSYRGGSLMKKMLEYIEENLIDENRTHSIIQIAIDNPASWINALKHGMFISKVDKDPADGVKVIYLEKEIKQQEPTITTNSYNMFLGNDIHTKIPFLFNKMQYLVKNGYHGVGINKETQSLIWEKQDAVKEKTFSYNPAYLYQYAKTGTM